MAVEAKCITFSEEAGNLVKVRSRRGKFEPVGSACKAIAKEVSFGMHAWGPHLTAYIFAEGGVLNALLDELRLLGQQLGCIGGDTVFISTIQDGVS